MDFDIYDVNGNAVSDIVENEVVFVTGITEPNNILYIITDDLTSNAAYGISDPYGNFTIPMYINGINEINKDTQVLVLSSATCVEPIVSMEII